MKSSRSVSVGWLLAWVGATALVALALMAPVLGGEAGAVVHHAFSVVCHQIPERSLHLHGAPAALCHRCLGIAVGFAAGLGAAPLVAGRIRQRVVEGAQGGWLVLAVLPTALDWLLGATGLWINTPASRTLTGVVFGLVAGVVLASNLLAHPLPSASPSPTLTPDA